MIHKKVTAEDREKVVKLFREGKTRADIARICEISDSYIRRIVEKEVRKGEREQIIAYWSDRKRNRGRRVLERACRFCESIVTIRVKSANSAYFSLPAECPGCGVCYTSDSLCNQEDVDRLIGED